jgi:hypothetical protein
MRSCLPEHIKKPASPVLVAQPVILATQEAEIRRIWFKASPNSSMRPYHEETLYNRAGGVAQGEGPEFKPQVLLGKYLPKSSSPFP